MTTTLRLRCLNIERKIEIMEYIKSSVKQIYFLYFLFSIKPRVDPDGSGSQKPFLNGREGMQ